MLTWVTASIVGVLYAACMIGVVLMLGALAWIVITGVIAMVF